MSVEKKMKEYLTPGLADDAFVRDQVPMTKEEVREISLCKLHLKRDSILYDVGSGTGSIAVEAALLSKEMKVYAFECNPLGIELIKKNASAFSCHNIVTVEGMAPESFEGIEAPSHAFLGGTKGNLKEILSALYKLNPNMRIVMNAVSLESICQMREAMEAFPLKNVSMVQLAVTKINPLGNYHMFQANNPVVVCSFDFDSQGE